MKTKVLYEDNEMLVIHKPAGIATHTSKVGQTDVVSELKSYLMVGQRKKAVSGRPPFLGVVHRLDQPVEGVLVFGKNPRSTTILTEQLKEGSLQKCYYAAVCGKPTEKEGRVVDYLVKEDGGFARVVRENYPGAKKAVSDYELVGSRQVEIGAWHEAGTADRQHVDVSLLKVRILTGRFHQIRVQMSHMGWPLLGDQKYGSPISGQISQSLSIQDAALCAYYLRFSHPITGKKLEYTVSPENRAFTLFQNFFS